MWLVLKNRLNETVLLSTQNIKLMDKKIMAIYAEIFCLTDPMAVVLMRLDVQAALHHFLAYIKNSFLIVWLNNILNSLLARVIYQNILSARF